MKPIDEAALILKKCYSKSLLGSLIKMAGYT